MNSWNFLLLIKLRSMKTLKTDSSEHSVTVSLTGDVEVYEAEIACSYEGRRGILCTVVLI